MLRRRLFALALVAVTVWSPGAPGATVRETRPDTAARVEPRPLPGVVLWAWERPEDLRFLDPGGAAAAVLLTTVRVAPGGAVTVQPRRQPLALPPDLRLVAVSRLEVAAGAPLGAAQRRRAVHAVLATLGSPLRERISAVQVDFDARRSERPFYAALLADLRHRLDAEEGPRRRLTVTALASWCLGDPWLDGLPVDDAVPMLFRMGVDDAAVRRRLAAGGDFASPLCRHSLGLATDEPWPQLPAGRRLYVFRPAPWTADALRRLPLPHRTASDAATTPANGAAP